MKISVLMPVLNEEKNLPAALESVRGADEIWVVDSHSRDRTAEIARECGANVVQFDYPGFGPKKKNWALQNLPFRNEWVLILDADERLTPALRREIEDAITTDRADGFYLDREYIFLGRSLKSFRPNWNLRLFKHSLGRYELLGTNVGSTGDNEVHEHVVLNGRTGYLQSPLLHEDYRPLSSWIDNHNRYSSWEAEVYRELAAEQPDFQLWKLLQLEPVWRKRLLKRIWVRLPVRPLLRFLLFYVVRRGFRDGWQGLTYAILMGYYEYLIGLKLWELNHPPGTPNLRQSEAKVDKVSRAAASDNHSVSTKAVQAAYYDRQKNDDFEIERPHGAGRLYEYLLRFKFERGLELLGQPLAGRSVLCVCAGAGMDVEFLATQGARVVGLDLSRGALQAAQERSRRHQFEASFVAGDAEHLPFPNGSFDYCYVHDGLHHLDEPRRALDELARVARRGVFLTEPANAFLTQLAIRLGLIEAREDAGNYVIRFLPADLEAFFRERGFSETRSKRYLMKYPHVPNATFRALSLPFLFPLAKAGFLLLGDGILSDFGNKISFAARRP